MSQVGFQDFWVAGSRAYFQRDAINAITQPWVDFGRLTAVNPSITPEQVELRDGASGIRVLIEESVTAIEESYDVQTSNMSLENLAFLFMSNPPVAFVQATAEKAAIPHWSHPERLVKLIDNDTALTKLYSFEAIFGVVIPGDRITTTANDIITMTAGGVNTIATTTDLSSKILTGDNIIVHRVGLAKIENARTYTVTTSAANLITVAEDVQFNESAVTVDITYMDNTSGTAGEVLKQAQVDDSVIGDWEIVSVERGLIKFSEDGLKFTFAIYPDGVSLNVYSQLGAVASRVRTFNPQDAKGAIQGTLILIWSRLDNTDQTSREMRVSLTPNAAGINDEEFSNMTLTLKVLNDLEAAAPAGRVLQFEGTTPIQS